MPPKGSNPDRLGRLILKAVRSLPQREQDEVLASLLGRSATPGPIHPRFAPHPTEAFGVPTPDPSVPTTRQMDQPLLVRLPAELHGRLREWATTHGFSMAAVARGLIERFLEEQRSS